MPVWFSSIEYESELNCYFKQFSLFSTICRLRTITVLLYVWYCTSRQILQLLLSSVCCICVVFVVDKCAHEQNDARALQVEIIRLTLTFIAAVTAAVYFISVFHSYSTF
jgi:hypothetical protein